MDSSEPIDRSAEREFSRVITKMHNEISHYSDFDPTTIPLNLIAAETNTDLLTCEQIVSSLAALWPDAFELSKEKAVLTFNPGKFLTGPKDEQIAICTLDYFESLGSHEDSSVDRESLINHLSAHGLGDETYLSKRLNVLSQKGFLGMEDI